MAQYLVKDENTLGYVIREFSNGDSIIVVMAVDYMAGGEPLLIDRETSAPKGRVRPATKEDFEHFRVRI